jgi:hypothetical protein
MFSGLYAEKISDARKVPNVVKVKNNDPPIRVPLHFIVPGILIPSIAGYF